MEVSDEQLKELVNNMVQQKLAAIENEARVIFFNSPEYRAMINSIESYYRNGSSQHFLEFWKGNFELKQEVDGKLYELHKRFLFPEHSGWPTARLDIINFIQLRYYNS